MFSILLITTNSENRYNYLDKNILSIEKALFKSNLNKLEKILSIDILKEFNQDLSFVEKYKDLGWKITYGEGGTSDGMVRNQLRGLSEVNSDWILYSEDDISFDKIIHNNSLNDILTENTGFISNTGFIHDNDSDEINNYINNVENYKTINDDVFLKKDGYLFEKKWFLNFPSCYIRREHLNNLLLYSMQNFSNKNISIEEGLSNSWFELEFDKKYNSYCYLKNNPVLNKKINKHDIEKSASINYWNNDESTRIKSVNNKKSMWF